ncbi:hypothetical protein H5410_041644 [Solanum commersonii]|uniref:Uncharacterized protein n=1 Tax=Solanum commersonii TaxID=4109 RepID=A0A9J5XTP2_SOLCO|nr:hypothetical protein H5410_041644 [Solanum commersonii]
MVDKDKGKSKKSANPKKKFKANAMRRPTGVVISDKPSRVNISKKASVSTTHSTHQSHNASTHVAPQSGYTISTPTVVPSSGYQTLQGYSHLGRGSNIPSSSASQCNSLNTSSGSIRLSNLHIESNGSEPNTPTTQRLSDAHAPQPGDRDNFRRLIIEPLGYNLRPDVGMAKIILKCIGTHYNGVYPNWSSIPLNTQGQMFNEFKLKASKLLSSTFCDCRRENRMPGFMFPDRWALLLKHWSTDEKFKKRSEIGKMARPSEKEGSLHTGGAISQVTRKERMSYERCSRLLTSRRVRTPQKKKDGLSHVLKRHMIGIYEYLRNIVVLYLLRVKTDHLHKKKTRIFGNRVLVNRLEKKKSWYCGSSSSSFDGGDRETISAMASKIAYLNAELATVAEREKKREEREKKREEEIAAAKEVENKRYAALQAQLTFLFESGNILPPCPASSDESDQEGDENDKSNKESEGDEE